MLEIKNLSKSFDNKTVLKDISISYYYGAKIGVIGENGSGKSTLAKLLVRDYKPDKGRISVGDMDIALISPEVWSERVGFVPQSPELLNSSILENIVMGRELDMEKVQKI